MILKRIPMNINDANKRLEQIVEESAVFKRILDKLKEETDFLIAFVKGED